MGKDVYVNWAEGNDANDGLTLAFPYLGITDDASYYCIVTNDYGSEQGLDIVVTVSPLPEDSTVPPVRVLRSGMAQPIRTAARPWTPDRRPIVFAAPYGANYGTSGNIWGTSLGFESSPTTWMADYKTLADQINTKRLMPHLWNGALQGSTYSMNFWHGMRDAGRTFFRTTMASTYAGYSIEPYLGGYLPLSRGLADLLTDGGQASTTNDMYLLAQNMLPLLQLGCTKCWVDAFASSETSYETLFGYLHSHLDDLGAPSRVVGTEPLPVLTVDSRLELQEAYLSERPYMMLEWNYKLNFDYDERWTVDPNTTEIHIIVDGSGASEAARAATPGYTSDLAMDETNGPHYLDRLHAAGFIVGTNHAGANNWVADWIKSRYGPTSTSNL